MDSPSISFRAFKSASDACDPAQRADLPVLNEVLTPSDPPECPIGPNGWTCATDSVRAQLDSVMRGLPAPPHRPSSRPPHLKLVAQASEVEAPALPVVVMPSTPAMVVAERSMRTVRTVRAVQVARSMLVRQKQEFDRLDAERVRQIERLTQRAEQAESQVRALEAHIAAERQLTGALGRRFGQQPHELFPTFVARLGMTAKVAATRGGSDRL